MTSSETAVRSRAGGAATGLDDRPGRPVPVPRASRRQPLRSKPGLGHAYRIGVFVAGLACIALGFALAVLPGPLTIPPVLLGLWLWSTEFVWAQRFFHPFKKKGQQAWQHSKRHPFTSTTITVAGLAGAAVAFW